MFSRSKYNWAVTQIQTSCKFDYAFDEETNDFVSSFLDKSEMYEMVNQARKESGEKNWHKLIAGMVIEASKSCEFDGLKQKYAHVLAGCIGAAKMFGPGDTPISILANAYEAVGLNPDQIITE
jgi:hypothetical protein